MPEPKMITKQMIEQVFDDSAIPYDRVGPNIFTQFGKRLIDKMPLVPGAHLLDVATGKGAVLLPSARRLGPQGKAIGIDLSEKILQEAQRVGREEGLTNIELRKMDAEYIEFSDQTFDFVTCAFALNLFPNQEAALREMYRVCKTGGFIGVATFDRTTPPFSPGLQVLMQQLTAYKVEMMRPQPLAYTPQELEALLGRPGFSSIQTYNETNDIVYGNLEDLWAFILTVPGTRVPIMNMNEETRAKFKDEYFAKLRPMSLKDGLHTSLGISYALAKR